MQIINVGVIGCGHVAEITHLPAYQNAPGVRVIGISDPDAVRLRLMARKFGVKRTFEDYHDLLDEDLDAVSVCVPTFLHHEVVVEAARKEKNILCEKPLACTSGLGEDMIAAASKNRVQLYVGFQTRFSKAPNEVVRFVRAGAVGKLFSVHAKLTVPGPEQVGSWYLKREKGGGVLFDTGSHSVDFVLHSFGDGDVSDASFEPSTKGDVDDAARVSINLTGNVKALIEARWWSAQRAEATFTAEGERGVISTDIPTSRVVVKKPNGILGRRTDGFTMYVEQPLPTSWAEITEFLESVRRNQKSELLASGEDALKALRTVEDAYSRFSNLRRN